MPRAKPDTSVLKTEPDERAAALADRLMGTTTDSEVMEAITGSISTDETRKPAKDEEAARGQANNGSEPPADDDNDEDDTTFEEEGGDENAPLDDDEDGDEEGGDADEVASDDEGEEEEEDEDQFEEVAYSDDDIFSVAVDGETKEVPLRDLLRAYSGEGAIEKRLQEATETRKAAEAEREAVVKEVTDHRVNLLKTVEQLDQALFTPMIAEPDKALRAKNMQEYLAQKDAWEDDQKRIAQSREALAKAMNVEREKVAQQRAQYRDSEKDRLIAAVPELRDPSKASQVQAEIMAATAHYGLTAEQVAQVDDHRLFLLARDAGRWLKMQQLKQNGGTPTDRGKVRKRKLKAGGKSITGTKQATARRRKAKVAAVQQAQRSGNVDDVAAVLTMTTRPKR